MRTHESDKVLTNHKFNNELMPIIINNIYFMDITYLEWGNTLYRVKYKNDHWLKKKLKSGVQIIIKYVHAWHIIKLSKF